MLSRKRFNIKSTFERARQKDRQKGAIVLLHNGSSNTVAAIPQILNFFRNYEVGSVPISFKVQPLPNLPAIWTDANEAF